MCKSCAALVINGVYCHETGCPDSHLDSKGNMLKKNCKECGTEFTPEEKGQEFCDNSCYCAYNGLPFEDEEEDEYDPDYSEDTDLDCTSDDNWACGTLDPNT